MSGTTTNFSWPYPTSTDNVDVAGDIAALAAAIDSTLSTLVTPVHSTSGIITAESGFSINSQDKFTLLDGKIIMLVLSLERTGADIALSGGGNLPDTNFAQLSSSGDYPDDEVDAIFSNGYQDGDALIDTSGLIKLRTSCIDVVSGTDLRFCATYIIT